MRPRKSSRMKLTICIRKVLLEIDNEENEKDNLEEKDELYSRALH